MEAIAKKVETFAQSFVPNIPESLKELDIPDSLVEDLVLRTALHYREKQPADIEPNTETLFRCDADRF